MSTHKISMGDEIEDITSKTIGIAIGYVKYLSGANYWIIQPYTTSDNVALKEVYIPEPYCKYKGSGIYPKPMTPIGFIVTDQKE